MYLIDESGNKLTNTIPQLAWSGFVEDITIASFNQKKGFMRKDGEFLVYPRFEDAWNFRNGFAAFKDKGKWGFIDAEGNIVVPAQYDTVGSFVRTGEQQ